ncbi:MAG: hypothetical protein ACFC03_01600 [Candidatus Malihini olakiniferum]
MSVFKEVRQEVITLQNNNSFLPAHPDVRSKRYRTNSMIDAP